MDARTHNTIKGRRHGGRNSLSQSDAEERFNNLFQEWEQYHFAEIKLRDTTFDNVIDYKIEQDNLDHEAMKLYDTWIAGNATEEMLDKFEIALSEFRSKLTLSILKDGKIRNSGTESRT